ncbi:MAG: 8-oxoguanine DNA glycosylase [Clostridia bacterium]|nr:8-oxoguanine DNA glycosylase [Clostridia bacterium]
MKKITFKSEYFNAQDTLDCGQIFRYKPINGGFFVFSGDKACFLKTVGEWTYIECEDEEYFKNFFDLNQDYAKINGFAKESKHKIVSLSAKRAKGVRILNQLKEETLFSFIISQNNRIPRIKDIIERTCKALGKKLKFGEEEYYSFPSATDLAQKDEQFFKDLGYGYRAKYMVSVAKSVASGQISLDGIGLLSTASLKKSLTSLTGVGPKVADCIALFAYHRVDSFPVDTWIEKLYREDFCGTLTDRNKITEWFSNEFGEYSGYVQQYVFYYKRSLEKYEN